jgi:carotenoid cleavage dioxygenase
MTATAGRSSSIFGAEDDRIDAELDVANFNKNSVYNVPGYQPVRTEVTHAPVQVTGDLPADLDGVYLRNGTNVQFDPTYVRSHAFVGAGMLHQVQIASGQATCSNVYIRTPRFEFERAAGREVPRLRRHLTTPRGRRPARTRGQHLPLRPRLPDALGRAAP